MIKNPFYFTEIDGEVRLNPNYREDYRELYELIAKEYSHSPELYSDRRIQAVDLFKKDIDAAFELNRSLPNKDNGSFLYDLLKAAEFTNSAVILNYIFDHIDDDFLSNVRSHKDSIQSLFEKRNGLLLASSGLSKQFSLMIREYPVFKKLIENDVVDKPVISHTEKAIRLMGHYLSVEDNKDGVLFLAKNVKGMDDTEILVSVMSAYLLKTEKGVPEIEQYIRTEIGKYNDDELDKIKSSLYAMTLEVMISRANKVKINENAMHCFVDAGIDLAYQNYGPIVPYFEENIKIQRERFPLSLLAVNMDSFKKIINCNHHYESQYIKHYPHDYLNELAAVSHHLSSYGKEQASSGLYRDILYEKTEYLINEGLLDVNKVDLVQFVNKDDAIRGEGKTIDWFYKIKANPKNNYYYFLNQVAKEIASNRAESSGRKKSTEINAMMKLGVVELSSDSLAGCLDGRLKQKLIINKFKKLPIETFFEPTSIDTFMWWHSQSYLDYAHFFPDAYENKTNSLINVNVKNSKGETYIDYIVKGCAHVLRDKECRVLLSGSLIDEVDFKGNKAANGGNNYMHTFMQTLIENERLLNAGLISKSELLSKYSGVVKEVEKINRIYSARGAAGLDLLFEENEKGQSPASMLQEVTHTSFALDVFLCFAHKNLIKEDCHKHNEANVNRVDLVESWLQSLADNPYSSNMLISKIENQLLEKLDTYNEYISCNDIVNKSANSGVRKKTIKL